MIRLRCDSEQIIGIYRRLKNTCLLKFILEGFAQLASILDNDD